MDLHLLLDAYCSRESRTLIRGDLTHTHTHTYAAPVKVLPFIGNPQKASFLSAHLRCSLLNSLTSQRPRNYSPQVYTGKQRLPLRDSRAGTMQPTVEQLLTAILLLYSLASSCQQGKAIESFYLGVYRQGQTASSQ